MKPSERLKEIERWIFDSTYTAHQWEDISWLIARIHSLTEALDIIGCGIYPAHISEGRLAVIKEVSAIAQKALEGEDE